MWASPVLSLLGTNPKPIKINKTLLKTYTHSENSHFCPVHQPHVVRPVVILYSQGRDIESQGAGVTCPQDTHWEGAETGFVPGSV